MLNDNTRTMEFIDRDFWSRPVYKCIETGILWKDINCGDCEVIDLYSCQNSFDGEPDCHIKSDLNIVFKTKYEKNPNSFTYMMLGRLESDCKYYLGNGNRYAPHLWALDEVKQIEEMKKLYNSLPNDQKPEWLTMEQIEQYEKEMCK